MVSSRPYYILTVAILLLAAGWIWVMREKTPSTTTEQIAFARPGFLAPDLTADTLEGSTVTLSSLRGQPVLVNVWASWCLPCRTEMPAIEKIFREYSAQGLQVLTVNATNQDELTNVNNFIQENRLTFPVVLDSRGVVSDLFQVRSLPTTFFIDKDGVIKGLTVGSISEALLRIQVEKLLAEKAGK